MWKSIPYKVVNQFVKCFKFIIRNNFFLKIPVYNKIAQETFYPEQINSDRKMSEMGKFPKQGIFSYSSY